MSSLTLSLACYASLVSIIFMLPLALFRTSASPLSLIPILSLASPRTAIKSLWPVRRRPKGPFPQFDISAGED